VVNQYVEIIEMLLEARGLVYNSLVLASVSTNNTKIFKMILDEGVDLSVRDWKDKTALIRLLIIAVLRLSAGGWTPVPESI
jgi:hypothetical protein